MSMDETVLKLEEVVVTATRTEENVRDVPVPVQIITTEEIEESGATNVGDLIGKYVTGHYHKYSGLQAPIGLRGFMTDAHGDDIKGHVLILVDGHRIGTGNMAKIPLDLVERIEIIKGPASALYGSAAMGGVLNIITKKGKGKIKTTLKQELGSFDYEKSSLSSGGMGDDKFAYHIAASYESAGNYSDPKLFAQNIRLRNNDSVELLLKKGKLIISPITDKEYTLEELLSGVTVDNVHNEIDMGKPVGKEVW
jgi:vitamin B12 transporter